MLGSLVGPSLCRTILGTQKGVPHLGNYAEETTTNGIRPRLFGASGFSVQGLWV